MYAMRKGSRTLRLLLIALVALGGMGTILPSAALAGGGGGRSSHHAPVDALLVVAGTAMGHPIGGSGFGNVWRTMTVQSSFSVSTVRDAYLYIYWTNLSGGHNVTLLVYSPDGNLYQRQILPISTDRRSSPTRYVPGVEQAVDVQRTTSQGRYEVSVIQLPIAGTWMTKHGLLGTWRVDVLLDEASTPIVNGTFTLTE